MNHNTGAEVQDAFHHGFDGFLASSKISAIQIKAASDIMSCRTAARGGHLDTCECGYTRNSYNSCRNRNCPKCQTFRKVKWIDQRLASILDVPHFHAVFTVPSQLHPLFLANPKVMYHLLFKASAETVAELASDDRYLGAQVGMTGVLHTWGQTLSFHPHIHMVVTGGGLTADRRWKYSKKKFFLPVRVLSSKFRGKLISLIRRAYHAGDLHWQDAPLYSLLNDAFSKNWVVYCKKPFGGSSGVYNYLGRYTHRTAIANSRIRSVDQLHTVFSFRDYGDQNREKHLQVINEEFVRRFLLHVLPHGFTRIRHFGIYASACSRTKLPVCRRLTKTTSRPPASETAIELIKRVMGFDPSACPICGKPLKQGFLMPARASP